MRFIYGAALWGLLLQTAVQTSLAQRGATLEELGQIQWDFKKPIKVCTTSIEDFGSRCNGSPVDAWESADAPPGGWCSPGVNFCGYDVDIWRCGSRYAKSY